MTGLAAAASVLSCKIVGTAGHCVVDIETGANFSHNTNYDSEKPCGAPAPPSCCIVMKLQKSLPLPAPPPPPPLPPHGVQAKSASTKPYP